MLVLIHPYVLCSHVVMLAGPAVLQGLVGCPGPLTPQLPLQALAMPGIYQAVPWPYPIQLLSSLWIAALA